MAYMIEVIDALERCNSYGMCDDEGCPYYPTVGCLELLRKDALKLLKEHEEQVQSWTKQISDKQFAHALDIRDSDEERTFNQGVKTGLQIALDIIKQGS